MDLVVMNVACPFAIVGPDAIGDAEQTVARLDGALTRGGHQSIVMACEGSIIEGILLATPRPSSTLDESERHKIYEQYRFTLQKFLEKWPIDLIHMHGRDFYEYLPPAGIPVLVTLHWPVVEYPEEVFQLERAQTFLLCVSDSQQSACPRCANLLPEIESGSAVEVDAAIRLAAPPKENFRSRAATERLSGPRLIEGYFSVYEHLVSEARTAEAVVAGTGDVSAFAG